ncbi:MAG: hypothetical protein P0Y53_23210 [Candidatus Pseudobacter hemicellulosilyticus]|uniref:Uncharacterized protein n=1 Tax=Candidatus Pseudobacter hemicellulosilyticus TaxID=3121375 RepID=A0AAJ5WRL3_9BACT|nr:MAG: hypothetical protein P0Y53_23210 [Pseudobacter sp.]
MPRTVQHILSNLEVTPPAGDWQQLASRLDAEYDPVDTVFAQKLEQWETLPPPALWSAISEALDAPALKKRPARIFALPFLRKVAVAVLVLAILTMGARFLMTSGTDPAAPATAISTSPIPQAQAATPAMPPIAAPDPGTPQKQVRTTARHTTAPADSDNETATQYANEIINDLRATDTRSAAASLPAAQPINVQAQPMRDRSGQLVMDRSLLTSPGANYVVVTGPNGQQTRLSNKFLPMLSALNGNADNSGTDSWKKRFTEWRHKLMQQATFAPSATNFLDILELKEMIEDK